MYQLNGCAADNTPTWLLQMGRGSTGPWKTDLSHPSPGGILFAPTPIHSCFRQPLAHIF